MPFRPAAVVFLLIAVAGGVPLAALDNDYEALVKAAAADRNHDPTRAG